MELTVNTYFIYSIRFGTPSIVLLEVIFAEKPHMKTIDFYLENWDILFIRFQIVKGNVIKDRGSLKKSIQSL